MGRRIGIAMMATPCVVILGAFLVALWRWSPWAAIIPVAYGVWILVAYYLLESE